MYFHEDYSYTYVSALPTARKHTDIALKAQVHEPVRLVQHQEPAV